MIYIPAIVALLVKIAIVYFSRSGLLNSRTTKTFLALLIVLSIANVLELLSYYYKDTLPGTLIALRIYYVTLLLLFAFLFQISVLILDETVGKKVGLGNYILSGGMALAMLFTDLFITGATSLGYTVTRIAGEYYPVFQLYAVLMLILSISTCIYGFKKAEHHFTRIQSMYVLIAVFFLALPIVIAIVLMLFEIKVNAAIILPIGTSIFLVVMTYGLNAEGLYDLRVWIPGTVMFKLHRSFHKEFMLNLDGTEMSAKERNQAHEKRYIIQALIQANGNQKKAAKLLDVSESTISLKRKKYNI